LSNGDQSDIELTFSMTDVRNASDLTDYTGELLVATTLRMTDRYNGGQLADAATAIDTPFRFAVPCVSTADPSIGSTCSIVTSADGVIAGVVKEGKRAVWSLGRVEVYDGGPDGDVDTADNTLFAHQGLFAP
jgi:hypothetical protein